MALWTSRVPLAVLLLLLLLQAACCIDGHKPVIIVHGIFDGPEDLKNLSTFIKAAHPDTEVHTISLYNHMESLVPLCMQVEDFRKAIEEIMNKSPEGVHLLCFSQGDKAQNYVKTLQIMQDRNHNMYAGSEINTRQSPNASKFPVWRVNFRGLAATCSVHPELSLDPPSAVLVRLLSHSEPVMHVISLHPSTSTALYPSLWGGQSNWTTLPRF
uniref:Palmitoyl-protein thioesterase 2 n=1 Tax=Fundulus heteroclitus TaxID=8078 RepID=A0A3Q2PB88_FUNHE